MQPRQPFLHDLAVVVAAPTQVLSDPGGDLDPPEDRGSAQGVLHGDLRLLSRVEVLVDGRPGEPIAAEVSGGRAVFTALLRQVGADLVTTPDPNVRLDRIRTVHPGRVREELIFSSSLDEPAPILVQVIFAADLATMAQLRSGEVVAPIGFDPQGWGDGEVSARLDAPGAVWSAAGDRQRVDWSVTIPARGQVAVHWELIIDDPEAIVIAGPGTTARPAVADVDHRLTSWLDRALDDLDGLRMATRDDPDDVFYAAGSPWYLTLFGRDSLWTARMLLPIDLEPARGTLVTLARRQGVAIDPDTAEEPGKILHELRRSALVLGDMVLPPVYYGTIDATPLWICLLHDAWRAGLPEDELAALAPALEAAADWLLGSAIHHGFLAYFDPSGRGLSNQGWKDSGDSVRFADGRIADGPVALCEVQGYAYEAAIGAAMLLDQLGRPGADRLRTWAGELQDHFRDRFWCGTGEDRFPALALDGAGVRVDSLTSNIGHLLGTGLLDAGEELIIAQLVAGADLDSGLGLRTMSAGDGGYAPLSYHCGSVWPHDTAIVIAGLHRAGLVGHAAGLIEGLLRASVAFEQRVPELWSGEGRPVPYPAACRPQAWSAAAAVVVADALGAGPAGPPG